MPRSTLIGTRIRARRNARGVRQSELAHMMGISPSYLNLIEHNRRKVSAPLLEALATALGVDIATLLDEGDTRLLEGARAAAERTEAALPELERIDDFTSRFPGWAAVLAETQARAEALEQVVERLSDRMAHDPYIEAALHEIVSAVTSVQSTAAILTETDDISPDWEARFHRNIQSDAARLAAGAVALVNYIDSANTHETGLASPLEEVEAWLDARDFRLADANMQDGKARIEALVEGQPELASDASKLLAMGWLERFFEDARRLPDATLLQVVEVHGLEPDLLAEVLSVPVDLVLRRLALMRDDRLPRMGLVLCDGSGTLTFRLPLDGFDLPRFGGGCPLWPLYRALTQPGFPIGADLQASGRSRARFRAFAIAVPRSAPRFARPTAIESTMLLLPATSPASGNSNLAPSELAVGASCRTCPLADCHARREPSILVAG